MEHLFDDIPRGRSPDYIGKPPNAHFELPENLAANQSLRFRSGNPESKIFLGVVDGQVVTEQTPDGRTHRCVQGGIPLGVLDDRHMVTMAGSRAGKGRSALLTNLYLLPATTSALVVDPKGDLARETASYRANVLGQKVKVFDPFGVTGSKTLHFRASFNPISILERSTNETFVPNAKLISDSLIVSGDFKDRHWDTTSQQGLAGLCAHVATYPRYEGHRNLITVWALASELATPCSNEPGRYWLEKEMLDNGAAGGMIRNAARQFYGRTGGEFSSVLSNLQKHLDWIGIECMTDCLCGDSVDLRELKTASLTIYVSLPAMRMADLSGWLRLIVQLTLAAHEEVLEPLSFGRQTLLMLDEFNILGRMECVEKAAAQIAGLGAKIWAIIQDLSQIQSKYPKSWETFIANAGVLQAFGNADQTSLKYLSAKLGQTTTLTRSTNVPTFEQAAKHAATGESWSLGQSPLMTEEEICRFFARDDKKLRQLILRPGFHPAILQRVFYDKHELFRGCHDVA